MAVIIRPTTLHVVGYITVNKILANPIPSRAPAHSMPESTTEWPCFQAYTLRNEGRERRYPGLGIEPDSSGPIPLCQRLTTCDSRQASYHAGHAKESTPIHIRSIDDRLFNFVHSSIKLGLDNDPSRSLALKTMP